MSQDHQFKHDAFIELAAIRERLVKLEKHAMANIHDVLGIETRDLCGTLINRIDVFEIQYQAKLMPKPEGV